MLSQQRSHFFLGELCSFMSTGSRCCASPLSAPSSKHAAVGKTLEESGKICALQFFLSFIFLLVGLLQAAPCLMDAAAHGIHRLSPGGTAGLGRWRQKLGCSSVCSCKQTWLALQQGPCPSCIMDADCFSACTQRIPNPKPRLPPGQLIYSRDEFAQFLKHFSYCWFLLQSLEKAELA